MSSDGHPHIDWATEFRSRTMKPTHKRVHPCFMTGKRCVYAEVIDRDLEARSAQEECTGFMMMPFRQNFEVFLQNCLVPFLEKNYGQPLGKILLQTGDKIRRPGVVICEGICKRIQESHFVVADISAPNPNVFYELGLAYGIEQNVVVIHQTGSKFGTWIAQHLEGCKPFIYANLDPIDGSLVNLGYHFWDHPPQPSFSTDESPGIVLYELGLNADGGQFAAQLPQDAPEVPHAASQDSVRLMQMILGIPVSEPANAGVEDLSFAFRTHLKSAVGLAAEKIHDEIEQEKIAACPPVVKHYLEQIRGLKEVIEISPQMKFSDIRERIDQSYCTIVRTGFDNCHPMAYFWLGYGHARGKNMIPITVVEHPKDPVADLAFDIRAQRHMTFIRREPKLLEQEIRETLRQLITADFSIWSRKRFWDEILGRSGEVHIFTGALLNPTYRREMIGDWDLRTASELTSYFGRHQYRAQIESPVYPPEHPQSPREDSKPFDKARYIAQLSALLKGKNCILVASADVNPLTEIVLGKIYHVDEEYLFTRPVPMERSRGAVIAVKEVRPKKDGEYESPGRAFYEEIRLDPSGGDQQLRRGFKSSRIDDNAMWEPFVNQMDLVAPFEVFAHLAVVPNPFEGGEGKHIIVLNGLSGPATFALTHVLTGGISQDFVDYEASFGREAESEKLLERLVKTVVARKQSAQGKPWSPALEAIIKIWVGKGNEDRPRDEPVISDWRRIQKWQHVEGALH